MRVRERLLAWREPVLVAAFFAALAIVLTWPLVLHLGMYSPWQPDVPLLAWAMAWEVRALFTNPAALFHANILFPNPLALAYADHMLGVVPAFIGPYLATGNALVAHNVAVLVAHTLAGLGMFVLVRWLTANGWAGVLAGVVFAYAPVRMGHVGHVHLLYFVWCPLALYCFERFVLEGRPRHLVGLGVAHALQCLTSVYWAWIATLGLGVYAAVRLVWERELVTWRLLRRLAAAATVTGALVGLVHLPYLHVRRLWGAPWGVQGTVRLSASPADFVAGGWFPRLFDVRGSQVLPWEKAVGLGVVGTGLALAGLFLMLRGGDRRKRARGLGLASVLALGGVLSLGPRLVLGDRDTGIPLPWSWLMTWLPGAEVMRSPGRFGYLVALAAAPFAGMTAARVGRGLAARGWPYGAALVPATLVLAFLAEVGPREAHVMSKPAGGHPGAEYQWLAERPEGGPIAEIPRRWEDEHDYGHASTVHWRPLVNGGGGFTPPTSRELFHYLQQLPNADAAGRLAAAGVRQVLVHHDRLSGEAAAVWREHTSELAGLTRVARIGAADVYELPAPPRSGRLELTAELQEPDRQGAPLEVILEARGRDGLWVQPPPFGRLEMKARWACPGAPPWETRVNSTALLPVVLGTGETRSYEGAVRAPGGWEQCLVAVGLPRLGVWSEPRESTSIARRRNR